MTPALARAERALTAAAAPDLAGVPLYLVPRSAVAQTAVPGVSGWTSGLTDLECREALGGRWRGRGPAAVVDDDRPAREVLATAVHELAHRLENPAPFDPLPDRLAPALAEALADPGDRPRRHVLLTATAADADAQRRHHSAGWVRVALHLARRVEAAGGGRADPRRVLSYPWLAAHAFDFLARLGDEPDRWADRPLWRVAAAPPPAGFERLWGQAAGRDQ